MTQRVLLLPMTYRVKTLSQTFQVQVGNRIILILLFATCTYIKEDNRAKTNDGDGDGRGVHKSLCTCQWPSSLARTFRNLQIRRLIWRPRPRLRILKKILTNLSNLAFSLAYVLGNIQGCKVRLQFQIILKRYHQKLARFL